MNFLTRIISSARNILLPSVLFNETFDRLTIKRFPLAYFSRMATPFEPTTECALGHRLDRLSRRTKTRPLDTSAISKSWWDYKIQLVFECCQCNLSIICTVGRKIIRTLGMIRVEKLILNAFL